MLKGFKRIMIISLVFILLMGTIVSARGLEQDISKDKIEEHLIHLTSPEFQGRKMGTEGNEKTIQYIDKHFTSLGLDPVENEYLHNFEGVNFNWDGVPIFQVIDENSKTIASYLESKDYRVRLDNIGKGGKFTGEMANIDNSQMVLRNQYLYEDLAVLLDYSDEEMKKTGLREDLLDDRIYYKDARVIIYPEDYPMDKRDINLGNKNQYLRESGLIKLGVKPEIYEELIKYNNKGYKVKLDIPLSFHSIQSSNILAMIKSPKNYDRNIVIATSIDGLGKDYNDNYYPGASDNALSTALLLELASYFKKVNLKTDYNIIFAAINGTQLGDRGLDNYLRIKGISPSRTQIIYLDKLGSNNSLKLGTFTREDMEFKKNQIIFNQIKDIMENSIEEFESSNTFFDSNYMEFRSMGIIASVLTNDRSMELGTTEDNLNNINIDKAMEAGEIVINYIKTYGRVNYRYEIIEILKSTWIYILIGVLLILLKLYYLKGKKEKKIENFLTRKPIISLYLLLLGIVIILTIQIKHSVMMQEGLLLKDVDLTLDVIGRSLMDNLLTLGPMMAFTIIFIAPILILLVILRTVKEKFNLNKHIYFGIIAISTYLISLKAIDSFYSYEFAGVFPELLSLPYSNSIGIIVLGLYSILIIYTLNWEKEETTEFKSIIGFILVFFFFVCLIYSPYLLSKTIVNIRATGGRIRY